MIDSYSYQETDEHHPLQLTASQNRMRVFLCTDFIQIIVFSHIGQEFMWEHNARVCRGIKVVQMRRWVCCFHFI